MKRFLAIFLIFTSLFFTYSCANNEIQESKIDITETKVIEPTKQETESSDVIDLQEQKKTNIDNKDNINPNTGENKEEIVIIDESVEEIKNEDTQVEIQPYDIQFIGSAQGRDVYVVNPQESRGYNIYAYFSLPKQIKLQHLLVIPTKDGAEVPYEKSNEIVKNKILGKRDYAQKSMVESLQAVLLMPVLPETDMRDGYRFCELDVPTLNDKTYGHLDRQLCSVIDDVLEYLNLEKSISLPKKVDMTGYSGEADFSLRFALLQPQRLHTVCVGGASWYPSMPTEQIDKEASKYPLGISDIQKYTNNFNIDDWRSIHFYIDQGLQDNRGSYHHNTLAQLKWSSKLSYPQVWDKTAKIFASLTPNAQLVLYDTKGHNFVKADTLAFIQANEGDKFVAITPSDDAVYYMQESGSVKAFPVKNHVDTLNPSEAVGILKQPTPIGEVIDIPSNAFSVIKSTTTGSQDEGSIVITDISGTYVKTDTGYHFTIKCKKPSDMKSTIISFASDYEVEGIEKKDGEYSIIEFDWEKNNKINIINLCFTPHDKIYVNIVLINNKYLTLDGK